MRASEKIEAQRINSTVDSWHHRMLRATLAMRLFLTLEQKTKESRLKLRTDCEK